MSISLFKMLDRFAFFFQDKILNFHSSLAITSDINQPDRLNPCSAQATKQCEIAIVPVLTEVARTSLRGGMPLKMKQAMVIVIPILKNAHLNSE